MKNHTLIAPALIALSIISGCYANYDTTFRYSVGGTVSGLEGGTLVLKDIGALSEVERETLLTIDDDGPFELPYKLSDNIYYSIKIETLPAGKKCVIVNGAGLTNRLNVTDIEIACADELRYAFVSSQSYTGNLGGLTGADDKCQALADASSLPEIQNKSWKAWLSTLESSASSRLEHSTFPYITTQNLLIAKDWDDLIDGELSQAINTDQNGNQVGTVYLNYPVWTNTNQIGNIVGHENWSSCDNFTNDDFVEDEDQFNWHAPVGRIYGSSYQWTHMTYRDCWTFQHLYCIQQPY